MNTVLEIIGVSAVVLIAGIVTYQFVQQQQALNQLSNSLESETQSVIYGNYQECAEWWQNPDNVKIREKYNLTIDDICNEFK